MALYLVTGGCGFIGSHLCAALLKEGHDVRVIDDLSTGHRESLPASATFICGSVTDPETVAAALDGVAGCFHLAAIASVEQCRIDWTGAHATNLTGTIILLDAIARQTRPDRIPFVYASSAAVYGNCNVLPIIEDAVKAPTSSYGADKYGCELHAKVAFEVYAIPTTGLRFFNVYGPRQDPNSPYSGVISIFASRISQGISIDIFGDGTQTRDFIAASDVVAALLQAMSKCKTSAAVYNVCSGQPTSVLTLADLIGSICQTPPNFRFCPPRIGEIQHSLGNPTNAEACLDWSPKMPLELGLRMTLDWIAQS